MKMCPLSKASQTTNRWSRRKPLCGPGSFPFVHNFIEFTVNRIVLFPLNRCFSVVCDIFACLIQLVNCTCANWRVTSIPSKGICTTSTALVRIGTWHRLHVRELARDIKRRVRELARDINCLYANLLVGYKLIHRLGNQLKKYWALLSKTNPKLRRVEMVRRVSL